MKTQHYKSKLLFLTLLLALLLPVGSTLAQSEEPPILATPLEVQAVGSAEISFAMLEESALTLRNNSTERVRFDLPARWQIEQANDGNTLTVYYDMQQSTIVEDSASLLAAEPRLSVTFDNIQIGSVALTPGRNQQAVLPLPAEAFADADVTQHSVQFETNLGYSCSIDGGNGSAVGTTLSQASDAVVTIHDTTFMQMAYDLLPPTTTLSDFPRPFGDDSLLPVVVPLVVGDALDEGTLEVAATVAATLGTLNSQVVGVELMTVAQVKDGLLAGRDAIIIGTPEDNEIIKNYEAYTLDVASAASATGVLHSVISPNGQNGYLLVTGQTMGAVRTASLALSAESRNTMLGFTSETAYIDTVNTDILNPFAEADLQSLSALGYDGRLYSQPGEQTSGLTFFVPADWAITDDARLSLTYGASGALANASGLTVRFNREPIGSVRAQQAANGNYDLTIDIPKESIQVGEINRITFDVANRVEHCNVPDDDLIWSRIFDDGALYLPHEQATTIIHNDPINPLLTRQDMTDIAFAVAAEPTVDELNQLLQTAWLIGRKSGGSVFQPTVILGEAGQKQLDDKHLIAIGQPSRVATIKMVNDALPQPFDLATDSILQEVGTIKFELPSDHEIGVIESIAAPWNAEKSVTVISGTSPEGVAWAANAVTSSQLNWQLNGNVAFVRDETISVLALEQAQTARQALAEVNAAVAEVVQAEEPVILEEVVVDSAEPTIAEVEAAPRVEAPLDLQSTPADYAVPPVVVPSSIRALASGLFVVGLASAFIGMFMTRRQNNAPAL